MNNSIYHIKNRVFYFFFMIVSRLIFISIAIFWALSNEENREEFLVPIICAFFTFYFIYFYLFEEYNANKIIFKIEQNENELIVYYNYLLILFSKSRFDLKSVKLFPYSNPPRYVIVKKGYYLIVNDKIKGSISTNPMWNILEVKNELEKYIEISKDFASKSSKT